MNDAHLRHLPSTLGGFSNRNDGMDPCVQLQASEFLHASVLPRHASPRNHRQIRNHCVTANIISRQMFQSVQAQQHHESQDPPRSHAAVWRLPSCHQPLPAASHFPGSFCKSPGGVQPETRREAHCHDLVERGPKNPVLGLGKIHRVLTA